MILGYFRGKELVNVIKDLEKNNSITLNEKNSLSIQFERCKQDNQSLMIELSTLKENYQYLNSKLALLQEDISKIYKSCMTLDACKGKTPNIRWYCNKCDEQKSNPYLFCIPLAKKKFQNKFLFTFILLLKKLTLVQLKFCFLFTMLNMPIKLSSWNIQILIISISLSKLSSSFY
jgi:hypothetical protein